MDRDVEVGLEVHLQFEGELWRSNCLIGAHEVKIHQQVLVGGLSDHDALLRVELDSIDDVIFSQLDAKLNVDVFTVSKGKLVEERLDLVGDSLVVEVEGHVAVAEIVEHGVGE